MRNTDTPSLPTGWEACCFGDIATIRNGYAFKSALFKKVREHESDVPLIRQSQMKGARIDTSDAVFLSGDHLKKHSDYVITKGDVIIGMSGSIGKVCLYAEDFPALQNQRTGKIVPHLVSELNPKFFGLFLSNIERDLTEFAKGMGVQNISAKDIEQLPFNLPPKNEQHRIVAKIEELFSELDKGIENLKIAQAQLKLYRQVLLKHAFEGKLTAQWRAENQDKLETADDLLKRIQQERAQRYQQQLADWPTNGGSKPKAPKVLPSLTAEELAELPKLPEGWGWFAMGGICLESILGKMLDKEKNKGELKPYLRNINVRWGKFALDDLLDMRFEESEYVRYGLEDGDLVICEGGEPGRCAVWRKEFGRDMQIQKALHRVRFTDSMNSTFVQMYFELCASNLRLEKMFTGTTIKHLTGEKLARMAIPICSVEEQIQILLALESKFSETDQLEQTLTTSLQQAEALRQSILKKAFSGLLVAQDPHDEPASALLARIKAERAEVGNNAASPRRTKKVSA